MSKVNNGYSEIFYTSNINEFLYMHSTEKFQKFYFCVFSVLLKFSVSLIFLLFFYACIVHVVKVYPLFTFVPGVPASPQSVTILTDTFTSASVSISWAQPPPDCVTGYRYTVSSAANEDDIIMEFNSTDSAVVIEGGLVPSDDQYCVVVTAIDTANRNSNDSDPACFIFNGE